MTAAIAAPTEAHGDGYDLYNEDCIPGLPARMGPQSADLCVTSIPFGALFSYSGKTEDVGNNADGIDLRDGQFGLHLRFFCEQLFRVLKPGCLACVHIQQLIATRVQHGYMGRRDFRGAVVDIFTAAGFEWSGEVAIPKNPQAIAQRQKLHSLLFVTGRRDSRQLSPAVNDYIMLFRVPGEGEPVRALWDGEQNPEGWVTPDSWIKWARGVWDDIRETDVLEGWQGARDQGDEKHPCPLQLEVIRRCVLMYSRPGAVVVDPFVGIGSTIYEAILLGRRGVGFDLKESYFGFAARNAEAAVAKRDGTADDQLSLPGVLAGVGV